MIITILNGDMVNETTDFSIFIEKLVDAFRSKNIEVNYFNLSERKVNQCTGCFTCWWKTPGVCSQKDSTVEILEKYMQSDFAIFASPLTLGFISSDLKKILDRFLALLHPYIEIRDKELHHSKRYEKYPRFGFLIKEEKDTDNEDLEILRAIFDRIGVNFLSKNPYVKSVNTVTIEQIINETLQEIEKQ